MRWEAPLKVRGGFRGVDLWCAILCPRPRHIERELEYRIPRLYSPGNSWRLQEIFGDFCKSKQATCRYSRKAAFSRLLPWISVESRSS